MSDNPSDFTPKQVRAARALLAWSQADLAKKAGVAGSTIADFERGYRTPVANNIQAVRTVLMSAGITFLPGGAIVGPPLPALGASSTSGAPIRWVSGADLAEWSDRRDGQGALPTLIAKLVSAANGPSVRIHFPSDEGVQFEGWDGRTQSGHATQYVPNGFAGWEFGTQRNNIAKKANEDYAKRTAKPRSLDPADSTFIFVTPRRWPKKEEWARQKRTEGNWRDVRAYDGQDLVHWIELYPAVGQWLATALGKRPPGARQLEDVWLEWSLATEYPLTPELVLSDRDEDAAAVLQWLRSEPALLSLQSNTAEEVIAFFYATINQLPAEAAQHYQARCLVAASADAARTLAASITPLIIVLQDPEPGVAQSIAKRGHHMLLAYDGNPLAPGDVRRLARPSRRGIERAVADAGIDEARARTLARESSRSLAVLRRLIPSAPGRLPDWARQPPPRSLLAGLLAGAWDERSEADKAMVARLGDTSYGQITAELLCFVGPFDSPLRKVGAIWKVASPQDAWFLLAGYLTAADIERFEAAAIEVLGEPDQRLQLKPDERWLAAAKGIEPKYSEFLRRGLGETLILLALFGERVQTVQFVCRSADRVVRKLLLGASRQRWWSLSRDFELLAEASPAEFLDAIEASLRENDPSIAVLYEDDGRSPLGGEHLSSLLWALESLAWAPGHLLRTSEILARLDRLDPGGRFMNRPANSLRQIFLLWAPQTGATLVQRLRVLDHIRKVEPYPAWKLMLGILPAGHDSFSPSPPTRWRDFTAANPEAVTWTLIGRGAKEITTRVLEDVGTDARRWQDVLERLGNLAPDRTAAIEQLSRVAGKIRRTADRRLLHEALRRVLHHHRQFPEAEWSLPEEELSKLEGVYDALAPVDPVQRVAWLFMPYVCLPRPTPGVCMSDPRVDEERRIAVQNLLEKYGVDALFKLARAVETAGYIGATVISVVHDKTALEVILERACRSSSVSERSLAHGIIITMFPQDKEPWALKLIQRAKREDWGTDAFLSILRALPLSRWTWEQAREAGSEVETQYWRNAPILWIDGDMSAVCISINKLLEVGRARDALHLAGRDHHGGLPSELLVKVLRKAIRTPPEKKGDPNEPVMFQHHVAEILKRLDAAPDVSEETMLALEWAYLPLLEYSRRPAKVLLRALSERPIFFIQVLSAVYKPSEDSGVVEQPPHDIEQASAVASRAYDLLRVWNRIPGGSDDGMIEKVKLEEWVKEARSLAITAGRQEIADQKIGEILSAAPVGKDGIWPAEPVRDVIEAARSSHLITGFMIGRLNRRGMTWRAMGDGGGQERQRSNEYRTYAKATAVEWPHVSAALERIAKSYDEEAVSHDEDAEPLDWY